MYFALWKFSSNLSRIHYNRDHRKITAIASGYMAFLWLPLTPEKLVTIAIALFLLKKLFPNDQKTLLILKNLAAKFK